MKRNKKKELLIPAANYGDIMNPMSDALGGAASGASVGMALGGIGGPIGAAAGGLLGIGKGLFDRAAQKRAIRREKKRRENIQRNQTFEADSQEMIGDDMMDYQIVPSFKHGGIASDIGVIAADNGEVVNYGGELKKVNAPGTGTDGALISTPDSVLGNLVLPGYNKTAKALGQELLRKYNVESKWNDKRAKDTKELNELNKNKQYNKYLLLQEEVKAKKGIKPKTKAIGDTQVLAADKGKAGFWSDKTMGIISNVTPILSNLFKPTDKAEVETPIQNPHSNTYLNSMRKRRVDTTGLTRALDRQRATEMYNAGKIANTGQGNVMKYASDMANRDQLQNIYFQQQEMNNQYLSDYGKAAYTAGDQEAIERRRIEENNAKNRAMLQTTKDMNWNAGMTGLSQLGSSLIDSHNTKEYNELLREELRRAYGMFGDNNSTTSTALADMYKNRDGLTYDFRSPIVPFQVPPTFPSRNYADNLIKPRTKQVNRLHRPY